PASNGRSRTAPRSCANAGSTASRSAPPRPSPIICAWCGWWPPRDRLFVRAMYTLFVGAPSERRRFLDRLALAVDAEHGSRVNALERSLRSRNRLLEEPRPDTHWLDAVEHETADLAVAVAGQRVETVRRLDGVLTSRRASAFPPAEIALDGWMEKLIPEHPAIEIEERYRAVLRDNRARDA